jgi:hypothetical protein
MIAIAKQHLHITQQLIQIRKLYPTIWKHIEQLCTLKGNQVALEEFASVRSDWADWPDWCYVPIALYQLFVKKQIELKDADTPMSNEINAGASTLGILCNWSATQGIYQFDDNLFNEIIERPFNGVLTKDIFTKLPEHSIYLDVPNLTTMDRSGKAVGVFVLLEYNCLHKQDQIVFGFDHIKGTYNIALALNEQSVENALRHTLINSMGCGIINSNDVDGMFDILLPSIKLVISLVAFLCTNKSVCQRRHPVKKLDPTEKIISQFCPIRPVYWDIKPFTKEKECSQVSFNSIHEASFMRAVVSAT